jgi:hypothetical protein
MNVMTCGHPIECFLEDCSDGWPCAWCREVNALRSDNEALKSVLEEKAFVVKEGAVLKVDGPIGYLVVGRGGTVTMGEVPRTGITLEPLNEL